MASDLELFVNNVRTLCDQGDVKELCDYLSKSCELLMKNASMLDVVLQTFDLKRHSLIILAILSAKLTLPRNPEFETLLAQIQEFITSCNAEQLRLSPDSFCDFCHLFATNLADRKMPLRGVDLLCTAIKKIQLSPGQLTPIHADLCQLCLLSKVLKPSLEFLSIDITEIYPEGTQFDNKYFLLYFYYGGMIYASLKDFEKALYFFEVAVTTPAMVVSHIMLEAYKKYVLVSLILHGKLLVLPKYTCQVVYRFIRPLSQAYLDLASACATNKPNEANATAAKHQDVFTRDKNYGLVKQVLVALYKKNIQRLTRTFLTLSLSDVASRVNLSSASEAEKYIRNMIEDGEIFAVINHKDGMVVFHDNPEKYNSPEMLKKLEDEMISCIQLNKKVQSMEEDIMLNQQFIKRSCGLQEDDLPGTSSLGKISGF